MKNLYLIIVLILTITTVAACTLGTTPAELSPTARPTLALQPAPTETQIKPIESQPTATPILDAPVIAYNDIKESQLTAPGIADEWVFNAKAGERVNIILNSQFDSYVELFNPDGEFVASNDDNGNHLNAALFELQLKKSGPHTIKVHGFDGAIGEYALALTGGHPTVGGGTLSDGNSRTVMLSKQGSKWHYQGQAGTYLTVIITAEDLIDAQLALYGPAGKLLFSDDDSGGNLNPEIFEFPIPEDGTYTIQAQTIAATGQVSLNINSSTVTSGGGPLPLGTPQNAVLKRGRSHEWTFEGETGQIINLTMNSADFDTFLELRDGEGNSLAENDDIHGSSNSAFELLTLPGSGAYTVIARGLSETDGGDYEITLKSVKVAPGGGELVVDIPTQALLVPDQSDEWSFEAKKGAYITIILQSDLLDTYLELYGPDNALLIADDDSGGELNAAIFDYPISESGQYHLRVRSARPNENEGGVYDILLTQAEEVDTTGQLSSDQAHTSQLAGGEQHTWTFTAADGLFATIKMESDTLDTYLALYDSSGELLVLNDDFLGTSAVIANFIIPEDGEYRVIARAYSAEQSGDYTISLEFSPQELPITPSSN